MHEVGQGGMRVSTLASPPWSHQDPAMRLMLTIAYDGRPTPISPPSSLRRGFLLR